MSLHPQRDVAGHASIWRHACLYTRKPDSLYVRMACPGALYGAVIVLQNYRRQEEAPHVWSWLPILGSAIDFGKDPVGFVRAQRKKHGDIFTVLIGGNRMVFVCDHGMWNSIFRMREALQFKPISYKVVSTAFQVPMSVINPVFSSEEGHVLHKQLITHMSGSKLSDLTAVAAPALKDALQRMQARASSPDPDGFQTASMYSAVARAVFDTTLETFLGADIPSDECWSRFTTFDSHFSFLAGGAPGTLFPSAIKALEDLCSVIEASPSYASETSPKSALMRERRRSFGKFEMAGEISRREHSKFQVTIMWAQVQPSPQVYTLVIWIGNHSTKLLAIRRSHCLALCSLPLLYSLLSKPASR